MSGMNEDVLQGKDKAAQAGVPGQRLAASDLVDLSKLTAAYYDLKPDPGVAAQRVAFGTSGHRGSSLNASFNEAHILAVTQAICLYRAAHRICGPFVFGFHT